MHPKSTPPRCPSLAWRPASRKTYRRLNAPHQPPLFHHNPCSFHVLHTPTGQRVRLYFDGGDASVLAGLPPGSQVAVSGSWLGAGGDVAAAGGPMQQQPGHDPRFCSKLTQILQPGPHAVSPFVQPVGANTGASVAGAAAVRTPPARLTTASFPLAASELPVLAIPSEHEDAARVNHCKKSRACLQQRLPCTCPGPGPAPALGPLAHVHAESQSS